MVATLFTDSLRFCLCRRAKMVPCYASLFQAHWHSAFNSFPGWSKSRRTADRPYPPTNSRFCFPCSCLHPFKVQWGNHREMRSGSIRQTTICPLRCVQQSARAGLDDRPLICSEQSYKLGDHQELPSMKSVQFVDLWRPLSPIVSDPVTRCL